MKYKTMQEIETRKAAILQEMEQEGADLDALKTEMEELRVNAQQIRDAAAKAEETRKAIASGAAGIAMGESRKAEVKAKTVDEIRGSKEYDVSAVSLPANEATSISARNLCEGVIAEVKEERLAVEARKRKKEQIAIMAETI